MPLTITSYLDEVKELFAHIERFKTLVQLALQDDLMYRLLRAMQGTVSLRVLRTLSRAIKKDTVGITSLRRRVTGLAQRAYLLFAY